MGSIFVLVIALLVSDFSKSSNIAKADFSGTNILPIASITASTSTLLSGTSQIILATSTARLYAIISNDGAGAVYLSLSGNPATVDSGILLAASSTYTIEAGKNLYIGSITAITSSASAKVLVTSSQ